jgi:hypothetical protein
MDANTSELTAKAPDGPRSIAYATPTSQTKHWRAKTQ